MSQHAQGVLNGEPVMNLRSDLYFIAGIAVTAFADTPKALVFGGLLMLLGAIFEFTALRRLK